MDDSLGIGLGIVFDAATLKQLNSIIEYAKKIQNELNKIGEPLEKAKKATVDMTNEFNKLNTKASESIKTVQQIGKSTTETFKQSNGQIVQMTKNTDGAVTKLKVINEVSKTIGASLAHNVSKMLEWSASAALIYGTINGLKNAFQTLAQVETAGIHVQRVLPTGSNMSVINQGAIDIAKRYGESLTDTMAAMEGWARKFKDVNDVVTMTDASLRLIAVTDIDLQNSFKDLSAIMTQFGLNTGSAMHMVDSLNEMSNNMRTTSQDVAEGLSKMGSAARMMGVDFDHATALVAAGVEATGATGSVIGTSLNRMLARIRSDAGIKQLGAVGINALDPNTGKVLDELGLKWQNLTRVQQESIAKALGGVVQWQKLAAVLGNYNRVIEATLLSYDSFGSAQKEINTDMSTLQKKIDQLKSSFQALTVNVGNGSLPVFKNFIDGLRILINIGDGIVPKIALITGAVWGAVTAFKAWQAASYAVSTTGVIGLIVAGVAIGATLIGWANSANKIADAQTRLSQAEQSVSYIKERGNQINYLSQMHEQLYQKLQKVKKGTTDYNDTLNNYKKVQEQVNKLGNEFGISADKSLSKYDSEKKQITQLITKIAELDKARQQAYDNELARQIDQTQKTLNVYQKLLGYQNSATAPSVKTFRGNVRTDKQLQAETDAMRLIDQIPGLGALERNGLRLKLSADPKQFFADVKATVQSLDLQLNDLNTKKLKAALTQIESGLGDSETNDKDTLAKRIARIKDTLTNELQAIDNQSKYYEKLGKNYDDVTKKVEAYNTAIDALSKIAPNDKELLGWAGKFSDLKAEQIINDYKQKAQTLGDVFMDTDRDTLKYWQDLLNLIKKTIEEMNKYDPNNPFMKQLNESAELAQNGINQNKTNNDTIKSKDYSDQQIFYVTSTLNALSDALGQLGTAAGDALSSITGSISKNMTSSGFNWQGMANDMYARGINMIASGIASYLSASKNVSSYNKNSDSGYSVSETMKNYKNYDQNKAELKELYKKLGMDEAMQGALTTIGTAIGSIWGPIGAAIGGAIGSLLGGLFSHGDSIKEKIEKLTKELEATWGKLKEALGVSVDNLASGLEKAFSADTYYNFLQNWNSSLYDMTRTALIRGFLASSAYQALYTTLSDTIALAVMDGTLSAEEILAIQQANSALTSQMSVLYQALNLLNDSSLGIGNNSSDNNTTNYTASSSTPITNYNYVNIYGTYFGEDEDGLRAFAILISKYITQEENRA